MNKYFLPLTFIITVVSAAPRALGLDLNVGLSNTGITVNTSLQCLVGDLVIGLLHQYPSASAYCSSYLSIKTSTITSTATKTLPDAQASTTTFTTTIKSDFTTITIPTTTTVTTTETDTTTSTITSTPTTKIGCISTTTPPKLAKRVPATTEAPTKSAIVIDKRDKYTLISAPASITTLLPSFISSGCSCLSIPTPSTTTTVTTTLPITRTITSTLTSVISASTTISKFTTSTKFDTTTTTTIATVSITTAAAAATVSLSNLAYYQYNQDYFQGGNTSYFKTRNYALNGTLKDMNSIYSPNWPNGGDSCNMDTTYVKDCGYITVIFQGYFVATDTGNYYFEASNPTDNFFAMWSGDIAYTGWDASNTDFVNNYANSGGKSFYFGAGDTVPMTFLWSNQGGPGIINFNIYTPSGDKVSGSSFFKQLCSGGPAFSPQPPSS